ncbi:MAG TPA: hypothetical protein VID25_01525 [Candidatus Limnocylindrales bacterium]|jgi:hypothetical protein
MDEQAAWELVNDATPAGWTIGRPIYLGNQRWAVWAIGPKTDRERQFPTQTEGTGTTQAEALTNLAAQLRRSVR